MRKKNVRKYGKNLQVCSSPAPARGEPERQRAENRGSNRRLRHLRKPDLQRVPAFGRFRPPEHRNPVFYPNGVKVAVRVVDVAAKLRFQVEPVEAPAVRISTQFSMPETSSATAYSERFSALPSLSEKSTEILPEPAAFEKVSVIMILSEACVSTALWFAKFS